MNQNKPNATQTQIISKICKVIHKWNGKRKRDELHSKGMTFLDKTKINLNWITEKKEKIKIIIKQNKTKTIYDIMNNLEMKWQKMKKKHSL